MQHAPSPPSARRQQHQQQKRQLSAAERELMNSPQQKISMLLQRHADEAAPVISPEARLAAKRRAALSLVRAAVALHKTPFESLPEQTLKVAKSLVPGEMLSDAVQTMHQQDHKQHVLDAAAAAARRHASDSPDELLLLSGTLGKHASIHTAGGAPGSPASARPLGSTFGSLKMPMADENYFFTPQRGPAAAAVPGSSRPHSPHQQQQQQQQQQHRSRSRSPGALGLRRNRKAAMSPNRGGGDGSWSPRRPPQVEPHNIDLQVCVNEVKLRIPAMRRGAASSSARGEHDILEENLYRLFTLMDARASGLLRLAEIAAFGKRIGGQTQQLLRVQEMRARLHQRYPKKYLSPVIFYSSSSSSGASPQQQQVDLYDLSSGSPGGSRLFKGSSTEASALLDRVPTAAGLTTTSSSQVLSHAADDADSTTHLAVPSTAASKRTVRVREVNPYEEPITAEAFVEAVMAAAEKKWTTQAPAVLLRASSRRTSPQRSGTPTQGLSTAPSSVGLSLSRPVSATTTRGSKAPATAVTSPKSSRPTSARPAQQLGRQHRQSFGSAVSLSSASTSGLPSGLLHGGANRTSNSRLQRTSSTVSTTSFLSEGATSVSSSIATSGGGGGDSGSGSGTNKASKIPTDPSMRRSFFQVVRLLDPKGTGLITLDALIRACPRTTSLDVIVGPEFSTRALFEKWDVDGDDAIDYEALADMFKASFTVSAGDRDKEDDAQRTVRLSTVEPPRPVGSPPRPAAPEIKVGKDFQYKGRKIAWRKV